MSLRGKKRRGNLNDLVPAIAAGCAPAMTVYVFAGILSP